MSAASSSSPATPGSVDDDIDQFMALLRAVRDRLDQPELLSWKTIYEDDTLQSSHFSERLSSCLSTAKVRKLVRYAAPRLIIGEHDDVVVTILWEGASSAVLSAQVGVKAQEAQKARMDLLKANQETKVAVRKAAVERAKQFQRRAGSNGQSLLQHTSGEPEIIEEVEEIEEIEEVEEYDDELAGVAPPPPLSTSPHHDDDVPPPPQLDDPVAPPPPPPPLGDDDEWDAPPPPPPEDDAPPPPPGDDDDGWDAPPPPPPLVNDAEGSPPAPEEDDWDVPPPPPPPED
jgi:hypothetical protein